jgi:hypothetical protein
VEPLDLADPGCPPELVRAAAADGPAGTGPRQPELLRFGWASAVLDAHPELHLSWADAIDRAVRRALMRSPRLPPEAAELIVATRRSGMHTLGANPVAPAGLLAGNPGAQRRRAAVEACLPEGLDGASRRPDDPGLAALGSPTVDLVLARSPALDPTTAARLAGRSRPAVDPWVLAVLAARYGARVRAAPGHASRPRLAAAAALEGSAVVQLRHQVSPWS